MIGNDCKILEENIDFFLDIFLARDKGETWKNASSIKLRLLLMLYKSFVDLAR